MKYRRQRIYNLSILISCIIMMRASSFILHKINISRKRLNVNFSGLSSLHSFSNCGNISNYKLCRNHNFLFSRCKDQSSLVTRQFSSSTTFTNNEKNIDDLKDDISEEETLYALSSGGGGSTATAVAVIRITGPQSHQALRILLSRTNRSSYEDVKLPKARYASLRMLYDPSTRVDDDFNDKNRDPLDSSLVLLFNAPSSFTGQDMVEIHTHGSRAVVQGVLSALRRLSESPFNINIRPADRGEFTQRAYGSGKLGLVEVEALADLIVADTSFQRLQALRQLDGRLSNLYEGWRKDLVKGLAHAEAVIDFGDDEDLDEDYEDGGEMNIWGAIRPKMEDLREKMERHLADAQRGEILRDGVKVCEFFSL